LVSQKRAKKQREKSSKNSSTTKSRNSSTTKSRNSSTTKSRNSSTTKSRKNAKKSTTKASTTKGSPRQKARPASNDGALWPIVGLAVLLALIITAILLLRPHTPEYPTTASRAAVLEAFRAHNVSEVLIVDLTDDFLSGNYTISELAKRYPGYGKDIRAVNKELQENTHAVLATVNGEPITRSELQLQESMLPPQYRKLLSEQQILQQMIDEKLLLQEATKRGITVSDDEVKSSYNALLEKGNLTADALETNLAAFGLTTKDLKKMIVRQLTVEKLFAAVLNMTPTTDEEARAFYDANPKLFTQPASVTVRHILIGTKSRSDAEAKTLAEHVLALYENGTDFCTLVRQYSEDPGSKKKCGEYTFRRGVMVPVFENASFAMKPDETRIVRTQFGEHLILKVNETPASQRPFDAVKEALKAQLDKQRQAAAYRQFLAQLRHAANITLANETQAVSPTITAAPADAVAVNETRTSAEEAAATTPANATVQEASTTVSVTVAPATKADDLAGCLKGKDVTLYTIDWATASLDEAKKYQDLVKVVDCSNAPCEGITAYPTWKINGELHAGSLSEAKLAQLVGC